jgi:HAE1 family hydrophobic/amphiphilic exporter-1
VARLRAGLQDFTPGSVTVDAARTTALGRLLGGGGADLAVRIHGDNLDTTLAHARAIGGRLATVRSLTNIRLGSAGGHPEIRVEIDHERAASYAIDPGLIAETVDAYTRGTVATELSDFDRKVPVVVRLPDAARHSIETLRQLRVHGVPLNELVTIREDVGPAEVRRMEGGRTVPVFADVAVGGLDGALRDVRTALTDLPAPRGVRVEIGGENEEMHRVFRAVGLTFAMAVMLVYMILAAKFESLLHPLVVLLSVPFGTVGAVLALWVTGAGLNAVSLIGIIVLVGIVDNDAVVKVDFINAMRRRGLGTRAAILEAGRARLRPIIINTITTVLGLLPMALGLGPGAALQAPLAIAVFGGLLTGTALTLIIIPVAYDLLDEARTCLGSGSPWRRFVRAAPCMEALPQSCSVQRAPLTPRPAHPALLDT